MRHHKLALTCATALLAISTFHPAAAGQAGAPAGQGLPSLTDGDRTFLSRLARRTVRDAMLGRPTYEPAYVPASLKDVSSQAVVRLRERGYLHDSGASGVAPIAQATRDAAIAAVAHLAEERKGDVTLANQLLIEIEIVGTPEPIEVEADWTAPGAVDPHIEPGVHGFMISAPQASFRFCPTEIYMTDMIVEEALTEIAKQVASSRAKVADIKLYRFRTLHWYEPNNGADIVALHRGLTVVPQSDVRAETLREHIDRLADYIAYRQLESGLFSYQYECGRDRYTPDDNLVRQAGTVSAMAWHASFTGRSASRAAADLGLRRLLSWKVDVTDPEGVSFLATPDGFNKLGVTALTCIAMAKHPEPTTYADVRERFITAMLNLQRPSGLFATAFPPAQDFGAQDYFPGEALLAMALHYELRPDARVLEAFDRALGFYRERFRESPSPAFMPWQVQAYSVIAGKSKRDDYTSYVFEMTDWLAKMQLTPENCEWPELWGGIASYQPGRVGVSTAAYLEGFTDALTLARSVGDAERARRYEEVVRLATRFVMQLQIRPEEAFFVRSPRDAIGGIRTTPTLNVLRIDHSQHALIALIKAHEALFPR
jgi:AMMECR1 domain-containing protein